MLYLELSFAVVIAILWFFAPKVILKPSLSSHNYDIGFYVKSFRRALLALLCVVLAILSLPMSAHSKLVFTVLSLLLFIPLLVDSRGQLIQSAWYQAVVLPWRFFLMKRWVFLGVTGGLVLYMHDSGINERALIALSIVYLLWAIAPVMFMLLCHVLGLPTFLAPAPDATVLGCALQVGALCITLIITLFVRLPWFWIVYLYLVLAYSGSVFMEILNFIGNLKDGYQSDRYE